MSPPTKDISCLEDVLDHNAHIAFYEWKALGGDEPCRCIHCLRYRFNKIPNEVCY